MKKNAVVTAAKTCTATCTADKESKATIKKLTAENSKLAKSLASANAKAAKAAQGFATKIAKANEKIAKRSTNKLLRCSSARSEQRNHNPLVEGSNPSSATMQPGS